MKQKVKSQKSKVKSQKPICYLLFTIVILVYAQEPTEIRGVTVEELNEKVRVTTLLNGKPQVAVYQEEEPPAIILDFVNTGINLISKEIIPKEIYPVKKVTVTKDEERNLTRVRIDLVALTEYETIREENLVAIDFASSPLKVIGKEIEAPIPERTISLYVKDADVVDLIRMLASQFDLDIVTAPEIKGTVTLHLSNVTLSNALDAIMAASDLNYLVQDNVMVIKPIKRELPGELVTKIVELKHIEAEDVLDAIRRLIRRDKGYINLIQRRVGAGGGSKRSSALLITDDPKNVENILTIIGKMDKPVPQIAIEAKFIETRISSEDVYGIGWVLGAAATATPLLPDDIGEEGAIPLRWKELIFGKLTFADMAAVLDIIQDRTKSRLLANPRAVTLDNQTAEMAMVTTVPIREVRIDPETRERIYTFKDRTVPIRLSVTPHVTGEGMLNMVVEPEVEAITGWEGPPDDRRPVTVRRSAKTQIALKDGEVAAIGGLMQDQETRSIRKIPLLGDIPILGNLFKKTSVSREKSELLIFIIPQIIPAQS